MKHDATKTAVTTQHAAGWHNDFSEQEESMTSSAMPPEFALTASSAEGNGGMERAEPKRENAPKLHLTGVPPELVTMLAEFEGIKWIVYADTNGHLTGGMGHRIKDDELAAFPKGAAISQAQVEAWAQQDVLGAWNRAKDMSAELGVDDHDFFVAMASMCFQNGLYWNTKHVKTWALMKEHRWEEAAVECADSDWARQTPTRVPGFQAALRSQAQPSAGDVLHKHARGDKSKAAKMAEAEAGKSSKGSDIAVPEGREGMKQIQQKLQVLGLYSGKIDGIAKSSKGESNTTKGIKQFQQMHKLPVTGVVDAATWAKLRVAKAGDDVSAWDRFMAGQITEAKRQALKKKVESKSSKNATQLEGWTVPPILGSDEFYSQLHPEAGPDNPIPRSVAFSKRLVHYERGGSKDIYDNSKCKDEWKSLSIVEREKKVYLLACKNTCDFIVGNAGYNVGSSEDSIYFLTEKKEGNTKTLEVANTFEGAKNRLDTYLEQGIPVVVGMDYKMNGKNASATDHFVIVIGRGEDDKGVFYAYMDVGRTFAKDGTDYKKNRIYVGVGKSGAAEENWISGAKPNNPSVYYSLSEVRTMTPKINLRD
jgi:peptidoglycan hydrolase-like protein with peptidoglycan-binding domain/GH24 family phage-related lysozyme (muramidase)